MNTTTKILIAALIAVVSYLIGGLNPAVFLSKKLTGSDIRESGSGNAGATNMLRTVGVRMGIITFALDVLKGVIPTLLALVLAGNYGAFAAGGAVVLGHIFPAFLGFKGGKGVATALGVLLVVSPVITAILLAVAALIMLITGLISLGSIIGVLLVPTTIFIVTPTDWKTGLFSLVIALLIVWKHRENIVRLIRGTENRIDPKKLKR